MAPQRVLRRRRSDAHSGFRDGWRHVKFMLVNAPSYLFTGPAIGLGMIGAVTMALSLLGAPVMDVYFGAGTMIVGSLVLLVGYQIGCLSLFSSLATDADPIQQQDDPVTRWIRDHFRLEHGATCGVALFALGGSFAGYLVYRWTTVGYEGPSMFAWTMIGFTAILLGVQTVFNSFFLSMLSEGET